MRIAKTAITTLGNRRALTDFGEIGNEHLAVLLIDLRAELHLQHDILAVGARAIFAHPVAAALALEVLLITIVDQGVEAVDGLNHDVAAFTAVAAVRAPELNKFLAPKRNAAVPAGTGRDVDLGFIEEFHSLRVYRIVPALAKECR